ncbi:MAG: metallophosphoesterase [Thermoplasmata archaeon]|nr:metallophosphoesterase [Thermoplasmata archaeon]
MMNDDYILPNGMVLSPDHVLYLPDEDILVISDLHIGYEASMRAEGVAMPDFQFGKMMKNLERAMEHFSPGQVIINGDIKHEFSRNLGQEWDEVMLLLEQINNMGAEVKFVRGNHDNYLKTIIGRYDIELANYYLTNDILITHGHIPTSTLLADDEDVDDNNESGDGDNPGQTRSLKNNFKIFGHEHPVLRLRDKIGARVTMPCFLFDEFNNFIIMPAFSPLASGTNVISPARNFMIEELRDLDISGARILAVGEGEIMDFGLVGDYARELES